MKSAIEEILNKTICKQSPDMGKDYRKAIETTSKKESALLELLKENEAALKAFEEFEDAEGLSNNIEMIGFYKEGFRNGFRIALDAVDAD